MLLEGGGCRPCHCEYIHVFIFRSHPMMSSFSSPRTRFVTCRQSIHCESKKMSTNAILATIAAIGAADVSYCKLSHPGYFLSSAVRGFAFSRLLLHAQGS